MVRNFLLLSFIFFFSATSALASEKFYTKHEVEYNFTDLGQANVSHKISLTNNESNYYVSSYQITLSGDPPGVVSGHDSTGPLRITTTQESPEAVTLNIGFNDQVVGKGKTLEFTINYLGRPAVKNGQVWEIGLPRVGDPEGIEEYILHLVTPTSFGKPAFVSPNPSHQSGSRYTFTKEQMTQVGVVAAFGNFQTFDFALVFELSNPGSHTAEGEIALPPDTSYQRVAYNSLDPQPEGMRQDEDGNWLAKYVLGPRKNLSVTATGQVHLLAEPTKSLTPIDPNLLTQYLKPTSFWPADDPQMLQLAKSLKTPQAIYNYVVKTLNYDYEQVKVGTKRKGALQALSAPNSSVCTEFTDLFITLARAAGIPAREVNGYAYTADSKLRPLSLVADVFHAWPQYFDSKRQAWVSIDPTWGNTTGGVDYFSKLDFSHFTFVTHGLSDSEPAITSQNTQVKFGQYQEFISPTPKLSWQPPLFITPFGPNIGTVEISNPSGMAIYQLPIRVTSTNIQVTSPTNQNIAVLLPYTKEVFPVEFATSFWPKFTPKNVTVHVANIPSLYNIPESLFLVWEITLGICIAAIITALGFAATKAWGIYLQKRSSGSSIRGQGQKPT